MTSAPMSARKAPAWGPWIATVMSTTVMPVSGPWDRSAGMAHRGTRSGMPARSGGRILAAVSDHPYVTEAMRRAFWDDGVVLLPQVLERTWMDLVALGVTRNLRNPGPYASHHYEGTPRAFVDDYCNYQAVPEYQMLLRWSPIVD